MTNQPGPYRTGYVFPQKAVEEIDANPIDWKGGLGKATTVVGGIGQISEGLREYSMSKLNAGISTRAGQRAFSEHMASVRQQVGSYVQQQASSGLVKNKDISWGASAKGAIDAAEKKYSYDIEASQEKYRGKMAKIRGISEGVTSISSAFLPTK